MTSPTTDCVKQVAQDVSLAVKTTGSVVVSFAKSMTYFIICLALACIIELLYLFRE